MTHALPTRARLGTAVAVTAAATALLVAGLGAPGATAAPSPRAAANEHAREALAAHPAAFRTSPADTFVDRGRAVIDPDGRAHVRYDREYHGLPVLGGDVVVHLGPNGSYDGASLTMPRPLRLRPTVTVSRDGAVAAATRKFDGTVSATDARRVIDATTSHPSTAWKVTLTGVRADQTPSVLHVIVDGATGDVRRTADEIQTGTGRSMYSGTVTIGTSGSSGSYTMKDNSRGGNYTTDLHGSTLGSGTTFSDADNIWGNGTASDRATAGVDAHYGAQETWDFYLNVLGRSGVFGNGTGVRSRVHYGNGYENAFWDGSQMTYGDGAGNSHPLTELDVAGHEMSHGVTENTAGLTYSGESGGLNEATSDIFGTAVEFYADNTTDVGDYLIGEKIDINGNGTPLRYMDKPSRDGGSADCWYSGVGNLDVHYSSGPGNHVFYLMSEGSGAKTINGVSYNSPTCNGSTVTGIGRDAATKIWYRALSVYMTSNTNYAGARTAAVNAAKDLYGASSSQCAGVAAAFSAINVAGTTCGTGGGGGSNLLQNPGFESGATTWSQTSGVINNDPTMSHGGSWFGWLDGYGSTHTDTLSQSVAIPSASGATLSLWLSVSTNESGSTPYDTLKVQVVSAGVTTTLATFSNANAGGGYVQRSFNVSSYVGRTVTIKLVGTEDYSLATSFLVDDFSLTTA